MMEIEKDMDVEGSHIIARQKTKETEKTLDYDYKKCAGCSILRGALPQEGVAGGAAAGDRQGPGRSTGAHRPGCVRLLRDVRQLLPLEGFQDDRSRDAEIARRRGG